MRSILLLGALCTISLPSFGCATWFGETHYFKSVDDAGEPINYYRLEVDGGAFLSSARYVSGFFDERALDAYFGESISQPEDGKILPAAGSSIVSLGHDDGGKLLMILSTNSDAIAEQIGQMAENQEIASSLARLIRRDAILGAGDAQLDLSVQKARGRMIAGLGDTLIKDANVGSAGSDELAARVLQYANALAQGIGARETFANLDDVVRWVERKRSTLGRSLR